MPYYAGEIDHVRKHITEMFEISSELETLFPGRKFTLDGHLVGSIGEVLASYYYDLELLPSSTEKHDAIAPDGRQVQIKATQGKHGIALRSEPEYLIVFWLDDNTGEAREVYNGPGASVWQASRKKSSNGTRSIALSKLRKMAEQVPSSQRVESIHFINKL